MILDNSMTMLVKVQPLRCRADSIIPTVRCGNRSGKAGSDGGNLAAQRESLLARTYEERTAKTLQTIVTEQAAKWVDTLRVTRVTQDNRGKKTAGVDGGKCLLPSQRLQLANDLNLKRKAKPIRRVWIPKPGKTEKRPLGIPVMYDRAAQTLVNLTLEPEWEAKFESGSYGFRPGRSAHDAIARIFTCIRQRPKFVPDADIKGCFDNIDHAALLKKIQTSPRLRRPIRSWLQAGITENSEIWASDRGTPQGGVLSPLLANIAPHGLQEKLKAYANSHRRKSKRGTKWLVQNQLSYVDRG
jgi:RNA-directed DNA polymerase